MLPLMVKQDQKDFFLLLTLVSTFLPFLLYCASLPWQVCHGTTRS